MVAGWHLFLPTKRRFIMFYLNHPRQSSRTVAMCNPKVRSTAGGGRVQIGFKVSWARRRTISSQKSVPSNWFVNQSGQGLLTHAAYSVSAAEQMTYILLCCCCKASLGAEFQVRMFFVKNKKLINPAVGRIFMGSCWFLRAVVRLPPWISERISQKGQWNHGTFLRRLNLIQGLKSGGSALIKESFIVHFSGQAYLLGEGTRRGRKLIITTICMYGGMRQQVEESHWVHHRKPPLPPIRLGV